ncbi:hypothetical protein BDEG_23439 [Batrachochytrium dendrobatidis JEL423]|nr:hypothetical protein BDEG_23439 [Batrachochytrium dendrobatidis JEL423]
MEVYRNTEMPDAAGKAALKPLEHVAALQAEIQELNGLHEKEKGSLMDTISKKNQQLEMQRIKLYRYELALKEAVLFLGKPLMAYDNWLNNRQGVSSLNAVSAALTDTLTPLQTPSSYIYDSKSDARGLAQQRSRHMSISPQESQSAQSSSNTATKTQIPANGSTPLFEKQLGRLKVNEPLASPLIETVTALESQCLECMRLALNFLQSAQKSIHAIDLGTYVSTANTMVVPVENESLALLGNVAALEIDSVTEKKLDSISIPRIVRADSFKSESIVSKKSGKEKPLPSPLNSNYTPDDRVPSISLANKPLSIFPGIKGGVDKDDEHDDGDLSTASNTTSPVNKLKSKCPTCREHLIQMDHLRDTIKELQIENQHLEIEFNNEKNAKKRIQQSKENIDQEIEELTSQLFDQANSLVSEHARIRDETETAYKNLRIKYQVINKKLQTRDEELRQLKKEMYDVQGSQMLTTSFYSDVRESMGQLSSVAGKSSNAAINVVSNQDESESPHSLSQVVRYAPRQRQLSVDAERHAIHYSHTIVAGYDMFESSVAVDGVIFQEFQEHVKTILLAGTQSVSQAYLTTYSTLFMKRCIAESVEPCLFYSYPVHGAGYSKSNVYGVGMSASFKKKLFDCAMKGLCEVKLVAGITSPRVTLSVLSPAIEPTLTEPSSQVTQAVPKDRCALCTIVRDCEYAIRLLPASSNTKQWAGLCRCCRDRVTSVLDFFTYSNYMIQGSIGPGKQGATILSIFRQMLWLCRRMSTAKIGSCSMFETALSAITGPGGGGDWETDIKILT